MISELHSAKIEIYQPGDFYASIMSFHAERPRVDWLIDWIDDLVTRLRRNTFQIEYNIHATYQWY